MAIKLAVWPKQIVEVKGETVIDEAENTVTEHVVIAEHPEPFVPEIV